MSPISKLHQFNKRNKTKINPVENPQTQEKGTNRKDEAHQYKHGNAEHGGEFSFQGKKEEICFQLKQNNSFFL